MLFGIFEESVERHRFSTGIPIGPAHNEIEHYSAPSQMRPLSRIESRYSAERSPSQSILKAFRRSLRFEPKCDLRIAQGYKGCVWTGGSRGFEAVRRSIRTPVRRVSSEPPPTAYNGEMAA